MSLITKLQSEIDIVMDAVQGKRGPEQQRIANEGLAWVDGPEVAEESIRDTIRDLGAYCLLWLACPNEVQS